MANKKKEYYKLEPMTEGKRNIIQELLQEYNIESAADIQEALKDLLGGTIKEMMESEDHFWDAISPIFKFSKDVRMVIYTINAIESLNSTYRQLNSQRSVIIIHILYIYMRYRPLKYSRSSTQNCMDFQIHYIF